MYCSNCGTQIQPELNYCSRCGARVGRAEPEARTSVASNLSSSLGYIGGFGLIGFIVVLSILLKRNVDPAALTMILLMYLGTLLGICFMILRQLKTEKSAPALPAAEFQNDYQTGRLPAADTAQLEEPKQQPVSSVTDHTTRTLDKIESKF